MSTCSLMLPGSFTVGCNYWASHAGAMMWSDWREDVVDADLAKLAAAGLQVLRVFPLWSDFQPITALRGYAGTIREMRFGEQALPDDDLGRAGVSRVMMDRFARFAELARAHGLQLIVGLVTGWMSGRTFAPPAIADRNLHTDPLALQWQARFVKAFVTRFRSEPGVVAWDLGNECNCMGRPGSREAAWAWTALITSTIRAADATRPVISGMHSLMPSTDLGGHWTIQDQAELTDVLTTHPYPLWTRHASQDPLDTLRTTVHATAESRFYADIGGKPCFAEEIGTMGPMMGDWEAAARFVRVNLFSLWANDCRGFLWWCAFDQTRLGDAPYDWMAIERELGLIRDDGSAKPMLAEISSFRAWLQASKLERLPERRIDAVCVLTRGQDQWAVAYAAWALAAQAKLSLRFAWADDPLPDARLYLAPSLAGVGGPFGRARWLE
ncbi:MAG: cellulase family glycosylhydrolase, partial [Planctomycetes bacterium]|nr:cellulase family glycosylhydrolase [Planctomycetota bacterium]